MSTTSSFFFVNKSAQHPLLRIIRSKRNDRTRRATSSLSSAFTTITGATSTLLGCCMLFVLPEENNKEDKEYQPGKSYSPSKMSSSMYADADDALLLQAKSLQRSMQESIMNSRRCRSSTLCEAGPGILTASTGTSMMDQSFPTWSFDKPCKTMVWNELSKAKITFIKKKEGEESFRAEDITDGADLMILGVMAPAMDKKQQTKQQQRQQKEEDSSNEGFLLGTGGLVRSIDEKLNGAITRVMSENDKTFKKGSRFGSMTPTIRIAGGAGAAGGASTTARNRRAILLGLGRKKQQQQQQQETPAVSVGAGFDLGRLIASKCHVEGGHGKGGGGSVRTCRVVLPRSIGTNPTIIQDMTTSFYETLYSDDRYRTGSRIKKVATYLTNLEICIDEDNDNNDTDTTQDGRAGVPIDYDKLNNAIDYGKKLAMGVIMAKDIVNAPHNVLNSESLAETAQRIADDSDGTLECKILDKDECEELGMGAYLGVARASETSPKFIHLIYRPPPITADAEAEADSADSSKPIMEKIGIIGKGLLFDAGGYNIKRVNMELMKKDCSGGAAALGAARAVAALKPNNIEVHFIIAACENMINEKGMVPSDILTASNGITIEVMNTDAEGRLTLADALVYADTVIGCNKIIELSTLTGSCTAALGKEIAGLFTANDELAIELKHISEQTRDKLWRMPLAMEYNNLLHSNFADFRNNGIKSDGGAITAALFLQNFVRDTTKTPYAHIDFSGPAWNDSNGATGYGVKLITEFIRKQ